MNWPGTAIRPIIEDEMPTLESLNTLKHQVTALGGEPRILSGRGEVPAYVEPSKAEPDSDPDALPDDEPANGGTQEMEALFGSFDDEGLPDTDDFDIAAEGLPTEDKPEQGEPASGEPIDTAGLEFGLDDSGAVPVRVEPTGEAEDAGTTESDEPGGPQLESPGEESIEELTLDDNLNFDEETGADALSDIRDIEDDSQQFSMDDFGDEYNFSEVDSGRSDDFGVSIDSLDQSPDEAAEDQPELFSISEDDFTLIQDTLGRLPRNLKLAVEELLAEERRSPETLRPLIDSLINGEAPKSLADRFYRITKRRIELPRGFERKSGRALELRRQSLSYRLMREGWPVLRTLFTVIAITWLLSAAVFMWVYRPLKAASLYREGLAAIAADDVDGAVVKFYDAWDGWPLFGSHEDEDRIADAPVVVKGWKDTARWLDYARALRRRKYWEAAQRFYTGYLAGKPGHEDARLEYANFLSDVLGRFESAVKILESAPPPRRGWHRNYTLAAGDVYLQWAQEDSARFEDARLRYAEVLERSRNDERAILSMMRYHLKIGNSKEILTLLPIFRTEKPGRTDNPELAAEVFAELAQFLLARGNTGESLRFVDLARSADPAAPEPFFAEALYRRTTGDEPSELNAYRQTLVNLTGRESVNRDHLRMKILSLAGIGSLSAANVSENGYSSAVNSYAKAVKLYEEARSRGILGASPEYGRIYLELGDIIYRGSGEEDLIFTLNPAAEAAGADRSAELQLAEAYYTEAEALFSRIHGQTSLPDYALYRRAYARYMLGRRGDALIDFYRVVRRRPNDYESRMALAGVLLRNGDYEASRIQYTRAVELLDDELRRSGGVLNPNERQTHGELLLRYIAAWNNMGVGRVRSAARGSGGAAYAEALSAFTIASDYQDQVSIDMEELRSRGADAMRDSNERRIFRSQGGRSRLESMNTYPYRNRARLLGLEEGEYLAYSDIPSDLLAP